MKVCLKIWKGLNVLIGAALGVVGLVLLVGSVGLAVRSLDAPVQLAGVPEEAKACSEELMRAVAKGDYVKAGSLMYGRPDLGVDGQPEDKMGKQLWQKFLNSISYEFTSDCYATDSGISRDAAITTLDIYAAAPGLKDRIQRELSKRVVEAEDMTQLYDENNNFREEMVMEIFDQAVEEALKETTPSVRHEITMNLIFREGQWWVVPDEALLQAISGNMAG